MDMSGIKIKLESSTDPLPSSLYKLKTLFETSTWGESEKQQILENLSIVEKECKTKEGRNISKLCGAYNIICGYLDRHTELNTEQMAQFVKTFDSLLGGNLLYITIKFKNHLLIT